MSSSVKPPSPWHMALRVAAVPLIMLVVYGAYAIIESSASVVSVQEGTITDKQCYEGRSTYETRIVGGRSWVLESKTPTVYAITVQAKGETLIGYVEQQQYASLEKCDAVTVKVVRRRLSGITEIVEIRKHQAEVE